MPGGFSFSSAGGGGGIDPSDIFRQFFGTGDPFAAENGGGGGGGARSFSMGGAGMPGMGGMGGMPGMGGGMGGMGGGGGFGGFPQQASHGPRPKGPTITHDLSVKLEDLYSGGTKKVRITRNRNGSSESVDKAISIKAGWKDGTKITFEREGDESPGVEAGDIVFVIAAKPHDRFVREGDDLVYTCHVTLQEALCGVRSSVTTLDNRMLPINAASVTPETVLRIPLEGMMNNKSKQRGDLQVKFLISFPVLDDSQRRQIVDVLNRGNGRK
jgi:DnaJ family protein B protein 4